MVKWNQAANALWLEGIPPSGEVVNGRERHFESLPAAVRFIMEDLKPDLRATAWITADDSFLMIEEIQTLHNDRSVLAIAANAGTTGVTATGVMLILGKEVAEVEAALGRLATEGLVTASDKSPRWFVTDAGRQAAAD